jgi:hypothetical protein
MEKQSFTVLDTAQLGTVSGGAAGDPAITVWTAVPGKGSLYEGVDGLGRKFQGRFYTVKQ